MASSSDSDESDDVPLPSKFTTDYLAHLQSRIQPLTRFAAQLPGPSDLSFHRSLDRSLNKDLDATKDDIIGTLNSLLDSIGGKEGRRKGKALSTNASNLKAEDLIGGSSFTRKMGDIVDTLLERADSCLDEYQGKIKSSSKGTAGGDNKQKLDKPDTVPAVGPLPTHLLNSNIQPLPQLKFSKKPDNSRESIWKHSLTTKPHSKVDLSWTAPSGPEDSPRATGTRQGMYCAEGDPRDNPYYFEINEYTPVSHALNVPQANELNPPPPLNLDDPTSGPIPFLWVDDEASFEKLHVHLMEDKVKEIAIDVEHHNFRSFQGLVCLVQISTRWQDFIIDGLSPYIRNISYRLNEVLANEEKVKILHGAEHDILWLQRDLNLYIVGLFDTYHATNVLNFPYHSLAFLLSRYINFEADKRYQLADWRIRPLNKEMMFYARSDTHSLIYIYDCLRFEISKKEGLEGIHKVFELSKRTASKVYAKEEWDPNGEGRDGWRSLWKKMGGMEAAGVDERWEKEGIDGLSKTERIFRALHDWRDQIARDEDEGPRYILSTSHILNLSSRAPKTRDTVLPCVGNVFKRRAAQVARLIAKESAEFEKAQKLKGDREREKLKHIQASQEEDEMGELVDRDIATTSASQLLWPTDEKLTLLPGPSAIASLLFGNAAQEAKDKSTNLLRNSLFSPLPKTANNTRILDGIKSDLTSALKNVLRLKGSVIEESDEIEQPPIQPETVAFVEKEDRMAVVEANTANTRTNMVEQSPTTSEQADTLVKVKKHKKKRKSSEEDQSSSKEKKTRWTKEEKEQRKKERESKAEELKDIIPFDYSTAKSILDAKTATPATAAAFQEANASKNKRKDKKKKEGKSSDHFKDKNDDKGGVGRYSGISVRRNRREQQGGKSMSFSH